MTPFISRLGGGGGTLSGVGFGRSKVNPSYSISASSTNVNEGSSVTFTVITQNVSSGTILYWTTSTQTGTINSSDFNDGSTSGSFTINNNSGSITRTLSNDTTTEGTESFQLQVRTGSTSGAVVATSPTVTINDTSLTPTYSVTPSTSSVNEGSNVTFSVNTTNVSDGTVLYWTILTVSGSVTGSDFGDGNMSGSFAPITSSLTSVLRTIASDLTTEGSESFALQVRTGSTSGPIVATSSTVTINDTSLDPVYWIAGIEGTTSGYSHYEVTYGGSPIAVDSSGSMYVASRLLSGGSINAPAFMKISSSGSILWQKYCTNVAYPYPRLDVDSNGNVYGILGATNSNAAYICKFNTSGSLLWSRQLTQGGYALWFQSVAVNKTTGDVYAVGVNNINTVNNLMLAKWNTSGTFQWQRIVGGTTSIQGFSVDVDSSGNVYAAGTGAVNNTTIFKYNSSGTLQWQRQNSTMGVPYDLACGPSGNVYTTGWIELGGGEINLGVVAYDSTGNNLWNRYIGNSGGPATDDRGYGIFVDSSENVFVCGRSGSVGGGVVARYNSSGTISWQRTFTGNTSQFNGISVSGSAMYIGASFTPDLFKLPSDGTLTGTYTLGGVNYTYASGTMTTGTPSGSSSTSSLSDSAGTATESSVSLSFSDTTFTRSIASLA